MTGTCDFCKTKNVEIWDIADLFLFFPREKWQQNICDNCITAIKKMDEELCYDDDYNL